MRIHYLLIGAALLGAACSRQAASPGAPGGAGRGGGPVGVKIVTLEARPLEDASELISTVRSLHSTSVQPQVEGRITHIFVKSGDVVKAGTPLLQLDGEKQAETVRNVQSQRTAREADVTYWTSQVARLETLVKAGAISQNELDTARHNLDAARANL